MSFQRIPFEQAPAVQPSGELRHLHVTEAADLEPAFGPRTECIQLGAGAFSADMLQLQTHALTVRSLVSHQGFQLRRWIGFDKLLVAYVNHADGAIEHGRDWSGDLLLTVSGAELDMSCLTPSRTTWIEIDLTRASQIENRELLHLRGSGNVLAAAGKRLFSELGTRAAMCNNTEAELLHSIQSAIQSAHASARERDRKDIALVRRVERFMWENLEEPLTLQRICEHANCRMRSLIYSFKEWFGLGPIKYLKILRFNGVHRRLRETRGSARIFDVAADFGFWHMGHFSTDYKKMFGVTAFETICAARRSQVTAVPKMHAAVRLAERPAADAK